MQKKTALAGLMAAAFFSNGASAFQNELDLGFTSVGFVDVLAAGYTHHFADVDLADTAWSEAAYMQRSSYLSGGVIQYSVDGYNYKETGFLIAGRATFAESWYAAASLMKVDDFVTNSFTLGYYYGDSKSIYLEYSDSDLDPMSTTSLGVKNVYRLAGDSFFNAEVALSKTDMEFYMPFGSVKDSYVTLSLGGDYYFTPRTGLGLIAYLADDTYVSSSYEIRFSHYFDEQIGIEISRLMDSSDTTTVGLNLRF